MSNRDFDEYERDEEMLEARRLRRLEMKRKRKIQQRIILGVLAVILVLVIVLIFKGCGSEKTQEEEQQNLPDLPENQTEEIQKETLPDTTATLAAVGDIMVYQDQIDNAKQEDGTYDFSASFSAISPFTISADLTVGNLETNFYGAPYSGNPKTAPYFNAPEALATNLKDIGFDILQTANTYSIMNGINGLTSTIKFLNDAGIDHVGTHISDPAGSADGGAVLREVNGIRIAFIGFTKGVNNMRLPTSSEYCVDLLYTDYYSNYEQVDSTSILERVNAAKNLKPDVIVAMLHWGSEYEVSVSDTQEDIATLLFRNGVDVILGSHSHVVGPMETRTVETVDGETKECFVAYSLGNFISSPASMDEAGTKESAILNLEFTKSGETGDTTISSINYTPLYILDHGEEADTRFEVLPIRNAIASSMFTDYTTEMTDAIALLQTNSKSEADGTSYDSGK